MSLHVQKDSLFHIFLSHLSHFVRVLTQYYGSNESNDSLGFFCVGDIVDHVFFNYLS